MIVGAACSVDGRPESAHVPTVGVENMATNMRFSPADGKLWLAAARHCSRKRLRCALPSWGGTTVLLEKWGYESGDPRDGRRLLIDDVRRRLPRGRSCNDCLYQSPARPGSRV